MTDKRGKDRVTTILKVVWTGILFAWLGYYYLLFGGDRYARNVDILRKLFIENGILYSRALQYILFGLFYIVLFIVIVRRVRSQKKNIIFALICGTVFASQIMVTDLVINYFRFQSRYASEYSIFGFFTSETWQRAASQYGNLGEYIIHFGFMASLLTIVSMADALYREWHEIQREETEEMIELLHCQKNAVKQIQILNVNTKAIIELYMSGSVGRNGIMDYVEKLPVNQQDGWQQLLALEKLFENGDPSIKCAIQRRKKYGKSIRRKDDSVCENFVNRSGETIVRRRFQEMDNVQVNKTNKIIPFDKRNNRNS